MAITTLSLTGTPLVHGVHVAAARHTATSDQSVTHEQRFLRAMEGQDLEVMGKCSTFKCKSTAEARTSQYAVGPIYSSCASDQIFKSQDAKFMKRARCTETYTCTHATETVPLALGVAPHNEYTETCTRKNNWGIFKPTCTCKKSYIPNLRYEVSIGAQPGNTQLRTVCYQRTPTHSKAWMFTQAPAAVRQGVTIPTAFYTDLMIRGYRLKYTAGRNGGGITIDETFCTCAPILQGGKTVDFVKALTNEYCEGMGRHNGGSNTCRAHAGWVYHKLSGDTVPIVGHGSQRVNQCPALRPTLQESNAYLQRFTAPLQNRQHRCVFVSTLA